MQTKIAVLVHYLDQQSLAQPAQAHLSMLEELVLNAVLTVLISNVQPMELTNAIQENASLNLD